ncbi:hypothetical protein PBI_KRATIO_70 [Mycobacterium phage Kratio]|uniref:Uncharacterized protein n=1 Tax=Mycobacterium phage Kratio TaxID=1606763 RepID=A0A0C5ADZ3_9CAUD|nr:hypothetical protein PBI_KRATIO_70 [Mycobacterium phage Kratio]AJK27399.1 hypothetical protein PBI_KRATIO_70 [Mycobacterium phage Kratio]
MTTIATSALTKLATSLLNAAADLAEAQRPIDRKTSKEFLRGIAQATNAIGYGMTPFEVYAIAPEYVADNPRPAHSAFNDDRKKWQNLGAAHIAVALLKMA